MACLMKLLSELYAMSLLFLTLLFFETLTLITSLTGLSPKPPHKPALTAAEYLTLVDQNIPPEFFAGDAVDCVVCLSELEDGDEIRRLRCGHVYHMACLDTWMQRCSATCPLCRARLLPELVRRLPEEAEFDGSDEEELLIYLSAAIHGGNALHSFYIWIQSKYLILNILVEREYEYLLCLKFLFLFLFLCVFAIVNIK